MIIRCLIVFLIFGISSFGQDYGEREAQKFFNSEEYRPTKYSKFEGTIEYDNTSTFKFGDKTILLYQEEKEFRNYLLSGAFNPDIILGNKTRHFEKEVWDTLKGIEKVFYNMQRNDSILLCCLHEFKSPDPKFKRYKFWLLSPGSANFTEYYIEFFNDKATRETDEEEFAKDAIMVFYIVRGLII